MKITDKTLYADLLCIEKYIPDAEREKLIQASQQRYKEYYNLTIAEFFALLDKDNLSGYDVAIVQLGTNDAARYSGWTETSITGFINIINKLKNENTNIKIFVSTISKRFGDQSAAGKAVISDGIRQLVLSLADPNVILLDMEEYAHTGDEQAYECGHYSVYGYWRLAQDYKNIIGYYINSHKNLFRTVQFIGTDYSYSD